MTPERIMLLREWHFPASEQYLVTELLNEIERLSVIERCAIELENFLAQNSGTTADWPIDLVARDEDSAEVLSGLLNQLSKALKKGTK